MATKEAFIVANLEELIIHTTRAWHDFVRFVDALSDDLWISRIDAAGWTVKDHVSHVTQWDVAVVQLFADGTPLQTTLGIADAEWDKDYEVINERIRRRNLNDTVAKVKSDRDEVWLDLLRTLEHLTAEQLATPAGQLGINVEAGDETPLLQTLVDYQAGHYAEHFEYIQPIVNEEALA